MRIGVYRRRFLRLRGRQSFDAGASQQDQDSGTLLRLQTGKNGCKNSFFTGKVRPRPHARTCFGPDWFHRMRRHREVMPRATGTGNLSASH